MHGLWDRKEWDVLRLRLGETDLWLTGEFASARAEVDGHLHDLDTAAAAVAFRRVLDFANVRRRLGDLQALIPVGDAAVPLYLVSTLFLREAYSALVRDSCEEMHFVTGSEFGHGRVLERLVSFEKARRSVSSVAGEPTSTHKALIGLEEQGHRLIAWMHSHPGQGAAATSPSEIDFGHQARLEQGGYPAIGAIFSRDGWVRFFSNDAPFVVEIFGRGVSKRDERLYLLDLD